MTPVPARRSILPKLGLALGAVAGALLAAELLFRFVVGPFPGEPARRTRAWDERIGWTFEPGTRFDFWKHDERGRKIFHSTQVVNAWGFADQPVPERWPEDGLRVLIVGDSFAEALQVGMDEKLGVLLERELAARLERPVEVVTLGRSGTGQAVQYSFWSAYRDVVRPHVLVLLVVSNDLRDNHPELSARYHGHDPLHPPRTYFMLSDASPDGLAAIPLARDYLEHAAATGPSPAREGRIEDVSALARFLVERHAGDTRRFGPHRVYRGREVDAAMFEHPSDAVPRNAREITRRVLHKFAADSRERGVHLILMTAEGPERPDEPEETPAARMDALVRGWAEATGAAYLSVYRECVREGVPYADLHGRGDSHWDPRGHRFAAAILNSHLVDAIGRGAIRIPDAAPPTEPGSSRL